MRAHKEILHGKQVADHRDVEVDVHLNGPEGVPSRLLLSPVVRSWKVPLDLEHLAQALTHPADRLHIVVVRPHQSSKVAEINIRHDKLAIVLQNILDFLKLLALQCTHVLQHTQSNDEIKASPVKSDWVFGEIYFPHKARGLLERYIDSVVANVGG